MDKTTKMTSYQKLKARIAELEKEKQQVQHEAMVLAYPDDFDYMEVAETKLRYSLKRGVEKLVWSGDSNGNGLISQMK